MRAACMQRIACPAPTCMCKCHPHIEQHLCRRRASATARRMRLAAPRWCHSCWRTASRRCTASKFKSNICEAINLLLAPLPCSSGAPCVLPDAPVQRDSSLSSLPCSSSAPCALIDALQVGCKYVRGKRDGAAFAIRAGNIVTGAAAAAALLPCMGTLPRPFSCTCSGFACLKAIFWAARRPERGELADDGGAGH